MEQNDSFQGKRLLLLATGGLAIILLVYFTSAEALESDAALPTIQSDEIRTPLFFGESVTLGGVLFRKAISVQG